MAEIAPSTTVAAPARVALSYGAFSVLPFRENADRWFNGISWETLTCEPAGVYGAPDCDATLVDGLPRVLDKLPAPLAEAESFTVYGHHLCSPIGNTLDWAQDQARAHLDAREEQAVETAIEAIIKAKGSSVTGVTALWEAVAALEQLFSKAYGGQGIIWTSRRVATIISDDGALKSSGGRLMTPLGTPVVAGSGISDGFIGITSSPAAYRGVVEDLSGRDFDLLDRGQNDLLAVAERSYTVGFEDCGLMYMQLDMPALTVTPPTPPAE